MKDSDTILSNQLPYEQLAKLGLDREKVEKLPQEVKEKLIKGEVTPLMEVSLPARNGMVITLPSNSSSPPTGRQPDTDSLPGAA